MGGRRLVFLFEWLEFCGRNRGAAADANREKGNQAERGFAAAKSCRGISIRDERSAHAVGVAAAERAKPIRIGILRVHADLRAGYFEGKCADAGMADELGGNWSGARRAAFRGADALQGAG